jgi:ribose 5-phosphate isomerase B
MTREHNDTNVLAMGAGIVGEKLAIEIADIWLGTAFSGDARHQRRIDKVMALEK